MATHQGSCANRLHSPILRPTSVFFAATVRRLRLPIARQPLEPVLGPCPPQQRSGVDGIRRDVWLLDRDETSSTLRHKPFSAVESVELNRRSVPNFDREDAPSFIRWLRKSTTNHCAREPPGYSDRRSVVQSDPSEADDSRTGSSSGLSRVMQENVMYQQGLQSLLIRTVVQ